MASLARLSAENLEKLPKAKRIEQLAAMAQLKIDANEDASFLLESIHDQLAAPSSNGRPGTGMTNASRKPGAHNFGRPPPTAASEKPSIAGSLADRITESLVSRQSEFRRGKDALLPPPTASSQRSAASRPGTGASRPPPTAASQRPPSTAASQRPPTTANSRRGPTGDLPRTLQIEDKPPVYDYKELLPDHVVQGFREEFRAMKAREEEAARAAEFEARCLEAQAAAVRPLSEVHNLTERVATPALSASSRPLTGHSEHVLRQGAIGGPPVPRPWSKKGRRGAPGDSRAARSEISEALSWAD